MKKERGRSAFLSAQVGSDAGVETTCFISPIFPGITDVEAIIRKAKDCCNLVWLENLNLRGDYKGKILAWIHEHHPELDQLYHDIYTKKDRSYWMQLDMQMRAFCEAEGLPFSSKTDFYQKRKRVQMSDVTDGL